MIKFADIHGDILRKLALQLDPQSYLNLASVNKTIRKQIYTKTIKAKHYEAIKKYLAPYKLIDKDGNEAQIQTVLVHHQDGYLIRYTSFPSEGSIQSIYNTMHI